MGKMRILKVAAICAATCFGGTFGVRAQDNAAPVGEGPVNPASGGALETLISEVVETHDRVLASQARVEAARQRSYESLGAWYPSLDLTANVERYKLERSQQNGLIEPAQEVSAEISQLLWDFGATNATIERARLEHVQSEISLVQTRQNLIAEALAAYINLLRSADVLVFAERSVENIRRQTGLEEARIEAGSGLSTDLLQAKTQLAGAQARLVDAQGGLEIALNRYRAVFGDVPTAMDELPGIDIDRSAMPTSLDEALILAFKGNPDIRLASIDISLANQDRIASKQGDFFPTFEIVADRTMTKNDAGVIGRKIESSIKLELSFPFNLGFTAINTLRAAQSDVVASNRTMADLERTVEERVRNAWKQLETAQLRSGHLFDQAGIAKAFLDVAIQERSLGQRSLIDVLAGETSLINAQSDAVSAEAEVLLAIVELLAASGALEYDIILTVPRKDRSEMLEPISGLWGAGPDPAMQLLQSPTGLGETLDPSSLILDPSQTGDGTTTITPPPGASPPGAPPVSTLEPAEPPAAAEPVPSPDLGVEAEPSPQDGDVLRDSLLAPPSFDAPPRPEPPSAPARGEEPTGAVDETAPQSEGGNGQGDGELDNPLFQWAQ
ncbi:TolC family protein [Rhodospirillaceae bacterium KN72]|uniref:TolC family protein n=1 Tax=Pacificispira spongiicola TaxID=2729598 RepID=A0A7Y0DX58_9PROT|nr:TolC family protein [Pacificispira spongiicola]NMM43243.1 TolC family protein [Pacificispira spongiicola]